MKKLITLFLISIPFGIFAQNNLHDAKILGSITIGNKEITSVLDETTGCSHKTNLHAKNLFVVGESVKIDVETNPNQPKIVKLNLNENIYVDKCAEGDSANVQMTSIEFKENVALLDARVRGINPTEHIREITLIDFSNHNFGTMGERISFDGVRFADEGTGYDLVAHDGIYTSIQVFNNGNKFSSLQNGESERVLSNPIVDFQFKHQTSLQTIIDNLNSDPNIQVFHFTLHCDVEFGVKGCKATDTGFCESCCFAVSNCNFDIGWQ